MDRTNSIAFLYRDLTRRESRRAWRAEQQSRRRRAPWRAAARRRRAAQTPLLRAFSSDLTADRKDQGMRVLRSTAVMLALIVMSAPRAGSAQTQPAAIAPEHQEMAAKRAKEKERVDDCQRQASEQKVLPRDRPQFVINCLDK